MALCDRDVTRLSTDSSFFPFLLTVLGQLLPLLHGNVNSSKVIITEFQEFCRQQASSSSSQSPPDRSSPQGSGENVPTR